VEPVSPADFATFLEAWQARTETTRRHGPAGLQETIQQLASAVSTAPEWEQDVLPPRIGGYQREWLDQATLSGEFVWLRLWGPWRGSLGKCPLSIVPRADLPLWLELPLDRATPAELGAAARTLHEVLTRRGAVFPTDLQTEAKLLPSQLEDGLAELVGMGLATCDSFAAMRQLAIAPSKRRFPLYAVGRWSLLPLPPEGTRAGEGAIELCARSLLQRFGVLSHTLLQDEKFPVPWRLLLRSLRAMELRGEVRGGRFVTGWSGEQYALPHAVTALRAGRNRALSASAP
ncbi:MAG: hypothetical protein KA020_17900, partial [Planctomycetes bacterium]|nr:hypothetical protein [Planctomycetota bacterium]